MPKIKLSTGQLVLISKTDMKWFSKHNFFLHKSSGYAVTKIKNKTVPLHKLILKVPKGFEIDHRNQNKLDNRRSNLRRATSIENKRNRSISSKNTTGYKGVCFNKKNKRYMAYIGKTPRIYLGSYVTAKTAARAYNKIAKVLHGKFACLNKIT